MAKQSRTGHERIGPRGHALTDHQFTLLALASRLSRTRTTTRTRTKGRRSANRVSPLT